VPSVPPWFNYVIEIRNNFPADNFRVIIFIFNHHSEARNLVKHLGFYSYLLISFLQKILRTKP